MSLLVPLAAAVVGTARAVVARLPARWKKTLDDRVFGAIFQVTRVTNDAYGWKAPPAGDPDP
ncbi:MAG: hypothetical protein EXR71_01480 [Myxococcales bacterium]|nr:hypothetical protein [Myxococcales bacterium]